MRVRCRSDRAGNTPISGLQLADAACETAGLREPQLRAALAEAPSFEIQSKGFNCLGAAAMIQKIYSLMIQTF